MQHVIVGAGPAGVVAAETLRKGDRAADIVLIGDEPEPPYSRMAIPYVLEGMIEEGGTHLRKTDGHYEGHGIQYRQGQAESVAPADGTLTLAGGEKVSYDRLLLSTGATPLSPPVPGLDLPGVYNCWTLADCRRIAALLNADANVVLIGAGFIGCIIMEALAKRCGTLAVVEMEDRMVSRMMDATAGGMLQRWCETKNIRVLTSARVTGIEAQEGTAGDKAVVLDSGERLDAHLVVMAVGVAPNVGFLEGSGIKTDHGVLVDQHLETSAKGVFAAGDVAQGLDFSTGEYSVHAIQPTATEHGRIAALNMLGRRADYKGSLNMNVLATVGLVSSSFGSWDGVGGDSGVAVDEDGFKYLRLEFDGEYLVGALGLGLTDHVGVIRGLIQNKTALADWKEKLLENPHRVMEAYVAHSQV
ncbi:MAG: FAD-dependent oxidoreductase [Rhodospirillales bacterium]|nr:FAD-dependent oxidoreductase [Rhodospirillales bacterium]MDE0381017.1 FAD-dependent oxidoreductase [Rhodospirillales bacterium]